jgi:hypothetical protein
MPGAQFVGPLAASFSDTLRPTADRQFLELGTAVDWVDAA